MFHYVTVEQFDILSKRFGLVKESSFGGVDARIVPTLEKLSAVPGIVPVWSCSGHPSAEQLRRKPEKPIRVIQSRYVIFSVTGDCADWFTRYDEWCSKLPYEVFLKYRPGLSAIYLNWGFGPDGKSVKGQKDDIYPLWKLEFTYRLHSPDNTEDKKDAIDPDDLEREWASLIDCMVQYREVINLATVDEECLNVIWDCLLYAAIEPTRELTKLWAGVIPADIQSLAEQWGWRDTEVVEQLTAFIKSNRNIEGKPHG